MIDRPEQTAANPIRIPIHINLLLASRRSTAAQYSVVAALKRLPESERAADQSCFRLRSNFFPSRLISLGAHHQTPPDSLPNVIATKSILPKILPCFLPNLTHADSLVPPKIFPNRRQSGPKIQAIQGAVALCNHLCPARNLAQSRTNPVSPGQNPSQSVPISASPSGPHRSESAAIPLENRTTSGVMRTSNRADDEPNGPAKSPSTALTTTQTHPKTAALSPQVSPDGLQFGPKTRLNPPPLSRQLSSFPFSSRPEIHHSPGQTNRTPAQNRAVKAALWEPKFTQSVPDLGPDLTRKPAENRPKVGRKSDESRPIPTQNLPVQPLKPYPTRPHVCPVDLLPTNAICASLPETKPSRTSQIIPRRRSHTQNFVLDSASNPTENTASPQPEIPAGTNGNWPKTGLLPPQSAHTPY